MQRTFDRKPQFDERSRNFRAVQGIEDRPFRSYTWPCKTWLDQGTEGACVGFGIAHELAAVPVSYKVDDKFAFLLYKRAQQLDPWEGEGYSGTSVLAGMQAVQEAFNSRGKCLIEEYRWGFGLEDVVRMAGHKGPVIIGVNWYTGMFAPDLNGYIHASGNIAGGHCTLVRGVRIKYVKGNTIPNRFEFVDLDASYATIHNSWGKEWGKDGTVRISLRDLGKLLEEDGEAVIPISRNK